MVAFERAHLKEHTKAALAIALTIAKKWTSWMAGGGPAGGPALPPTDLSAALDSAVGEGSGGEIGVGLKSRRMGPGPRIDPDYCSVDLDHDRELDHIWCRTHLPPPPHPIPCRTALLSAGHCKPVTANRVVTSSGSTSRRWPRE